MKHERLVLTSTLLLACLLASAINATSAAEQLDSYGQPSYYDDSLHEKWKESKVTIPAYPDDKNLLSVSVPETLHLKILIDVGSVSQSADRVVRFSIVAESASGVRNVFYEGIRCETQQYKTYALGTARRTLEAVKEPRWRDLPRHGTNAFRYYLYRDYVCNDFNRARRPAEIVSRVRSAFSNE